MARNFYETSLEDFLKDFSTDEALSNRLKAGLKKCVAPWRMKDKIKDILHLLTKEELLKKCCNENQTEISLDSFEIDIFLKRLDEERRKFSAGKIFNDPIHGSMEIHPACVLIIDTPQFQRLRYIKQLGMCYFVFPGASHNRFEHSIGTCYLAGQFCRSLRENQPELGITDMDILCVEIAGLCHDLGQGPFSRLFVDRFLPSGNRQDASEKEYARKHKVPSAKMFDFLLEENPTVKGKLKDEYGIGPDEITFIKEQIDGPPVTGSTAWPYRGRKEHKAYLYEIVSNLRNGIDVCKWDYLARDCHHLGMPNNFDHRRYMKFARVIEESGEHQICLRDKEAGNVYHMFYTRYTLNKNAYKHPANCAIEEMVVDVLDKAAQHLKFGRTKVSMSKYHENAPQEGAENEDEANRLKRCHDQMSALSEMTDDVLYKIRFDGNTELADAQNLLKRIYERNLYTCEHKSAPIKLPAGTTVRTIKDRIIDIGKKEHATDLTDKFFVQIVYLDFGMKEENPVRRLRVFRKKDPYTARHLPDDEVSRIMYPPNYDEQVVRFYSKSITDQGTPNQTIVDCLKDAAEKYIQRIL